MIKRARAFLLLVASTLVGAGLLVRFGRQWLRALLLYLSHAAWARQAVSEYRLARRVADRFVAGEEIDAAMTVARNLNATGISVTLDYLGENVSSLQDAFDARDQILSLLDRIKEDGVDANVSIKLSQLGIKIDPALARDNARAILERARQLGNRIRIDMEEHAILESTLATYRALRDEHGFGHQVGIVIQAYLFRSEADVRQLIEEGAWVRLCKGAYAESPEIAFPVKSDTDASFVKLMQLLMGERARETGVYLAIATHDEAMIRASLALVKEQDIPADAFEFQMLYGIRRDLQESLVSQGYHVRVYVPFGTAWYPYLVRRLAEHPANLRFFVSNLLRK